MNRQLSDEGAIHTNMLGDGTERTCIMQSCYEEVTAQISGSIL